MTLQVLLKQIELRWHDRICVVDDDLALTYGETFDLARRVASLARHVTGKERPHVAALLGNRWEYVTLDLGCAMSGETLVRLNARDTARDIAYLLEDSHADCFIYSQDFAKVAAEALALSANKPKLVELPSGTAAARRPAFEAEVAAAPVADFPALRPSDPYKIMYTSGTTGKPKGVIVTHEQWMCAVVKNLFTGPLLDLDEASSILHVTPLTHISGGLMWPFMVRGGAQIISRDVSLDAICEAIEAHGVTHTFLVPTLVTRLLAATPAQQRSLRKLKRVYYAGSPIGVQSLKTAIDMFGAIFAQGYGSTEAMWWLTYMKPDEHRTALESGNHARLSSCGRPSFAVDLDIVDDEGRSVRVGELGEVATRGQHVARAYINKGPVPRDETIGPDWFRIGDIGYRDEEGYIYLVDRKNSLIITGGFNVYPGEVEGALASCSGIAECCVVGVPDEQWGEIITAVVVRAEGAALSERDVFAYARAHLADYRRPKRVHFADVLPQNSAGKVDRRAVKASVSAMAV